MNNALSKRIILSPDQLRRLLGRDRELTNVTDAARMSALADAAKAASIIGPGQAYAQFNSVQQRHLNQAANERNAPLELVVSDPAVAEAVKKVEEADLIDFSEKSQKTPKPKSRIPTKKVAARRKKRSESEPRTPSKTPPTVKRRVIIKPTPSPRQTRSRTVTKPTPSPRTSTSKQKGGGEGSWLKFGSL